VNALSSDLANLDAMAEERRKYDLKVRAERQRQTRERIVAATVALHETVGPARTTVAEVARRAGVQRLTVYNNFPDETELLAACQAHYFGGHPPPDFGSAFALADPDERLKAILRDLYRWYRACAPMLGNSLRDRSLVPALDALLSQTVDSQFAELGQAIVAGWVAPGGDQRVGVVVALALDFRTWQRMAEHGLDDEAAAELMTELATYASRE
jgi:AcrR family transcriptional regulator